MEVIENLDKVPKDGSEVTMTSPEDDLLYSARNGQLDVVDRLLHERQQGATKLDINCKGKKRCLVPLKS